MSHVNMRFLEARARHDAVVLHASHTVRLRDFLAAGAHARVTQVVLHLGMHTDVLHMTTPIGVRCVSLEDRIDRFDDPCIMRLAKVVATNGSLAHICVDGDRVDEPLEHAHGPLGRATIRRRRRAHAVDSIDGSFSIIVL